MITKNQAAKAYQRVRTMIAAQRFIQPIGLREIHVSAEIFEVLEAWERLEAKAMHKEYSGVYLGNVEVLPPFGYKQSLSDSEC